MSRDLPVTSHALDGLLVIADINGRFRGIHRRFVAEFLIAPALDKALKFAGEVGNVRSFDGCDCCWITDGGMTASSEGSKLPELRPIRFLVPYYCFAQFCKCEIFSISST